MLWQQRNVLRERLRAAEMHDKDEEIPSMILKMNKGSYGTPGGFG